MMGLSSITTVDSTDPHLRLSSLPLVDLRLLSQAELRSLSLCRDDAFDLRRIDGDVAPAIDRSIFNESAGSRRQTYSRRPSPPVAVTADDPELRENKQIAQSLCQLLSQQQNDLTLTLTSGERPPEAARRRERASTAAIVVYKNEYEVLNRSGAVVDVAALADWEDPYGAELRRRTEGLETEEELLGFLNGLEGQWGSRRKKRKIVDAGDFGDELPVGWKLLLGLKRREGRASLNCRRYISPNGQQFISCKEVSSYLLPYVRPQEVSQPVSSQIDENTHRTCNMVTESTAGPASQVEIGMEAPICYSATPISSISTDYEKQIVLFRVENPAKAQLRNLLECRKCNLNFGDKDSYVQHLLSFHKRNAKRCRFGKSIADGVIIKDGKFECQFCQKTFDEKRRYNSHVGIHVRDYDKSLESLPDDIIVQTCIQPTALVLMPSAITEMDALGAIGIAKDTTTVISMTKSTSDPDHGPPHIKHSKEDTDIGVIRQSYALEALATVSTSVDERDNGREMIDDKLRKIVEASNTMGDKINNCMDATISISSKAANVTCDAYCDRIPSSSSMVDRNDKSGKDQKSMRSYSDIISANKQTHGTNACDASYDKDLSPCRMLDENDKSGNEHEKGTESNSDIVPYYQPTGGSDTCDASHDKDLSPSNMLDENDISSNDPEKGIGSCLDILSDDKSTPGTVVYANEMGKSSNELDCAFESGSTNLPDSEQTCIETSVEDLLNSSMKEAEFEEMEKFGNGMGSDLGSCHPECDKDVKAENALQNVPSDTSSLLLQSSGYFTSFDMISEKGEDFSSISQKLGSISDFNELVLNEIGPPNFGFVTGQGSTTLSETSLDLAAYGAQLELGLVPSVSFEWGTVPQLPPKMGSRHHQLTTICVWCRREFDHGGLNLELQSDSVGFMCPACKANISGQLNVLDNGLSMNSNRF
ncbi:hypothetical protein CKAN_01286100 [Cinnamomum micranthum f. kanehirae]|uniref:Methyl-CpG-binding domain-containing protein 8 n=1 Tax=Cinnamomum micranthum f. kanehirae TaxID=337451 RepID=A0A3S3MQ28_9MAGN|nr:hypothetical protein CKAN_01286100 [Cinnamomum micranthum f. kanehirae]